MLVEILHQCESADDSPKTKCHAAHLERNRWTYLKGARHDDPDVMVVVLRRGGNGVAGEPEPGELDVIAEGLLSLFQYFYHSARRARG